MIVNSKKLMSTVKEATLDNIRRDLSKEEYDKLSKLNKLVILTVNRNDNVRVRIDCFKLEEKDQENTYWNWIFTKELISGYRGNGSTILLNKILNISNLKVVTSYKSHEQYLINYLYFIKEDDLLVRPYCPIGYIYKITCLVNNKVYVGQCQSPCFVESYWSSSQNPLYWKDLETYGKDQFKREIIEWCYSYKEIYKREQYYIKYYEATNEDKGYNIITYYKEKSKSHSNFWEYNRDEWWTEERRKKHGEIMQNSKKYKKSRETVGKSISETLNKKSKNKGFKEKKYAFTKTEEFKNKIAENNSGKKWYTNGTDNIFIKGEPPTGFKKGMIQKIKHSNLTEEHKQALREAKKGRHWYTNGIEDRCVKECPGENWILGRHSNGHENLIWWTNGIKETKSKECPGENYIKGRLNTYELLKILKNIIEDSKSLSWDELAIKYNTTIPILKSLFTNENIQKVNLSQK